MRLGREGLQAGAGGFLDLDAEPDGGEAAAEMAHALERHVRDAALPTVSAAPCAQMDRSDGGHGRGAEPLASK